MIELKPITPKNYERAKALRVSSEQSRFVAPVINSLADAYVYKDALFRLAYLGDSPIGYVLVYPYEEKKRPLANIVRIMIDSDHQGKGLGKELLQLTLDWIASFEPPPKRVRISTLPDNDNAIKLYKKMGFKVSGEEAGETVLWMDI